MAHTLTQAERHALRTHLEITQAAMEAVMSTRGHSVTAGMNAFRDREEARALADARGVRV